jgi:tetratricopeptide (TPR) repeat protein
MKTKIILIALLVISLTSILKAQNSAVTNAILYLKDSNLLKAKQNIDLASEHEKTKGVAKTWYYKGLIYSEIYKSDKVEVKEKAGDALRTSTDALLKAKELENNPNGEYSKLAENQLLENWVSFINRGSAYHQTNKFQEALEMFEIAQKIRPNDTTAYVYAAFAADGLKKDDIVQNYCNKLLSMNYKSLYVYTKTINAANNDKNYEKAISLSNKALVDFPLNHVILQLRTIAYAESGKTDEGIEVIKSDLKAKPYDIELLTNLAVLYNYKKDTDKAMEAYSKIIAIEPHNFFANYNASVINFEKGKALARNNDSEGAQAAFKKSLVNAKRAKALASDDHDVESLDKLISELNSIIK